MDLYRRLTRISAVSFWVVWARREEQPHLKGSAGVLQFSRGSYGHLKGRDENGTYQCHTRGKYCEAFLRILQVAYTYDARRMV